MLDKKERNRNIYNLIAQNSNLYFSGFRNDDKSLQIFTFYYYTDRYLLYCSLNFSKF